MTNNYIEEFFAAPVGLKPVYKEYGTTFFSSDKLKQLFILAFEKSSKGKAVSPQIKNLVEKGIVIPCYKSKNLFSFIKSKLKKDPEKNIMAFYAIDTKKVIVIIDNSSSIFGTSSNNELASTTIHECMHLASGRNLSKFLQIFMPNLKKYYSEFFKDFLSLKVVNQKKIEEVIKFLVPFEKNGDNYANRNLSNYFRLLEKLFLPDTNLQENDFRIRLTNMIVAAKLFIVSMSSLIKNRNKFMMLFTSLNRAYEKAFGTKNKYSMPIQELITLSEVACILAEMQPRNPTIIKLFKIIK